MRDIAWPSCNFFYFFFIFFNLNDILFPSRKEKYGENWVQTYLEAKHSAINWELVVFCGH